MTQFVVIANWPPEEAHWANSAEWSGLRARLRPLQTAERTLPSDCLFFYDTVAETRGGLGVG